MTHGLADSFAANDVPFTFPLLDVASDGIARALKTVRAHLGMDIAFISEFLGDSRVFRHVDTAVADAPVKVGDVLPLDDGYCRKVVEGFLPELIPDTGALPEAMAIPATRAIPIGAHISVPLRLASGQLFGTFCCFSYEPDKTLNQRDLGLMKTFAELIGDQLGAQLTAARRQAETTRRIAEVLASEEPSIVFQPIVSLSDRRILGAEALSRFAALPARTPDLWFSEAQDVGRRVELELKAISNAVDRFGHVAERDIRYLALNSSPETMLAGGLLQALDGFPPARVVIEITEHAEVADYAALIAALKPLRAQGALVAIDDAGSGYSSMRHILNVQPDFIKLDTSLTRGIEHDPMRRAMAAALIGFSRETGSRIVAEGVETEAALETLLRLGAHAAQGYHISKPVPLEALMRLLG